MNINDKRNEIDRIGAEIVELLARRFAIAKEIGGLKAAAGLAVADGAREDEVISLAVRRSNGRLSESAIRSMMVMILAESRRLQSDVCAEQLDAGAAV